MKLLDYIQGLRKGKEAHRLERESMQDPFLADAMDGYSQVEGNHEQRIKKTANAGFYLFDKEKEHPRYYLEHRCLSGYRIRYQQLFPVPEKEYDGRSVHCQRECFLQVG